MKILKQQIFLIILCIVFISAFGCSKSKQLHIEIATPSGSDMKPKWFTESVKNLKARKENGNIVIIFDFDAVYGATAAYSVGMVVVLFDERGNNLTKFRATNYFTASDMIAELNERNRQYSNNQKEITLVKSTNNRISFPIANRDLKETSAVKIGFYNP